jgi:hypothetical protein
MMKLKMLLLKEQFLLRQRLMMQTEEIRVLHDPENPIIEVGALFPDIITFRKAIRHYAVETGFEFSPGLKTDPTRFIAKCKHSTCPWRIHASRLHDQKTIQVQTTCLFIKSV